MSLILFWSLRATPSATATTSWMSGLQRSGSPACGTFLRIAVPRLAEIVAPGVGVVLRVALPVQELLVVLLAPVAPVLISRLLGKPDLVAVPEAVPPVHEDLRLGEAGALLDGKQDIAVDRALLRASLCVDAGPRHQLPGRKILEVLGDGDRRRRGLRDGECRSAGLRRLGPAAQKAKTP